MGKSNGQSSVISTVIITSISLLIIIAMLNYAFFSLESTAQQAEFEEAKNILKNLAISTVKCILTGEGATFKFPSRTLRTNFITFQQQLILHINFSYVDYPQEWLMDSNISKLVDSNILKVICYGGVYVGVENEVIYGLREIQFFVNDTYDVPLVHTYRDYDVGRTAVSLDFLRLIIHQYNHSGTYFIDLIYVDPYWESSEESALENLDVKYSSSTVTLLYNDTVAANTSIIFSLELEGVPYNSNKITKITIDGSCRVIIRLIVHRVLYYSW
ncbi:MAG: hypothetical protein DRJ30_07650 [Candidatus Methanomethylicota archaeon]|nr:MAG: hypothetical protein DRJ30_07650 [Candidatus Verstraetearchaeota archaeon]